jgi:hypothetical protein
MLNLLIAVVSDTYARVESSSQDEMYKNLSDLIIENSFLVPSKDLSHHDKSGDYLYVAKQDDTQISEETIEGKVQLLEQVLVTRTNAVDHATKELIKTFENALSKVAEKHTTIYIEESMKSEMKFKQYMGKLEAKLTGGKHIGSGNPSISNSPSTTDMKRLQRRKSTRATQERK